MAQADQPSPAFPARRFGEALRQIRLRRGLSVERLAAEARVGRSTISQIERGECAPTINVVARIARALETDISALVAEHMTAPRTVVMRSNAPRDRHVVGGLVASALFPDGHPVGAGFYRATLGPHERATLEGALVGAIATIVVAEGELVAAIAEVEHDLRPGDTIVFRVDDGHALSNPGDAQAVLFLTLNGTRDEGGDGGHARWWRA